MTMTETRAHNDVAPDEVIDPARSERRGRRWLIWSFILCPCHLPVTMTLLAVVFGGSAFGALISRNTIGVGVVFGVIYVLCLAVGFQHLRAAAADKDCASGNCYVS